MSDFQNLEHDVEKEARDHPQQADQAVKRAEQEADQRLGGKDHGMVDKAGQDIEKDLGGGGAGNPPAGQ